MSKKIGFLQRWMFIIDKINAYPYINIKDLKEAVANELSSYDGAANIGITQRTIERDLSEIRNSPYMDISIEFCRKKKGYYIPQDEKSASKLDRLLELSSLLSFSNLKDIVLVENRKSKGLEHRFQLINAIQNTTEVIIDYHKYSHSSSSQTERKLRPYALREFKSRWYLLAAEVNGNPAKPGTIKTFGLDRIKKLAVTNQRFEKDTSVNLQKKFSHCFGIYSNEELEAERVVLSFSPLSGKYNDSLPLHETQRTLLKNENEFRVELFVKLTQDFIMELLSQSEGMRVIMPICLKERLIDIHLQAIDLLRK